MESRFTISRAEKLLLPSTLIVLILGPVCADKEGALLNMMVTDKMSSQERISIRRHCDFDREEEERTGRKDTILRGSGGNS
jgi:hypothetical protein